MLMTVAFSVFILPTYAFDSEFILECSTWHESYLLSKSDFILVWGRGVTDCYDMLDSWTEKLFLWHNDDFDIQRIDDSVFLGAHELKPKALFAVLKNKS